MEADGRDAWLNANPFLQDSLGNVGGQTWSPHLEEPQVDNSAIMSHLLSAPLSLGTVMDSLHWLYLISFKGRWRPWDLPSPVSNSASTLKEAKTLKSVTRLIVKAEGWHWVSYIFSLSLSISFFSVYCIYISVQHVCELPHFHLQKLSVLRWTCRMAPEWEVFRSLKDLPGWCLVEKFYEHIIYTHTHNIHTTISK